MSVDLKSMEICGNILCTKNYNFFALRCIICENVFGQWSSFIKHLIQSHIKNSESNICNKIESEVKGQATISNDMEYFEEECNYEGDTLTEKDENIVIFQNELPVLLTSADEQYEENIFIEELDVDRKEEYDFPLDESNTNIEMRSEDKPKLPFHFNVNASEYKAISLKFLKLLEQHPVAWNEQIKKPYLRTKSLLEIKLELKKDGYITDDGLLRRTIGNIIAAYKEVNQELIKIGVLSTQAYNFLDACKFLAPILDTVDPNESDDQRLLDDIEKDEESDNFDKEDIDYDTDDGDSEFETHFPPPKARGRNKNRKLNRIELPTYTYVSKKDNTSYKKIRFHLVDSKISIDFINLVRNNPILWDRSLPNFNRTFERKELLTSWILHFINEHNETFTYDDLAFNLMELRRYFCKLVRRKNLDESGKILREKMNFFPISLTVEKYQCEHCDRKYCSELNYKNHLYKEHKIGESPFTCVECNKEFSNAATRAAHMGVVHLKTLNYPCTVCHLSFFQPSHLKAHMSVHTGEKRFICETCGKGFRRKMNLNYHETRIHLRQRNYPCNMCPKAFYTKALLRDHMNAHLNIRNHKCPFCDKGFHSAHALMRHKQIHSEIKRYACKMCDARFSQFVGLNAHMKTRHQFVHEKNTSEPVVTGLSIVDCDDPENSNQETIEVKRMDEYVYSFSFNKNV